MEEDPEQMDRERGEGLALGTSLGGSGGQSWG